MAMGMMQPQIILLREGTDTSQGTPQLISNINACMAVVDTVRTTLGPRGMDKLVHDDRGRVTISNDGATIMKLLDIVHPAAKVLADISMSQDAEVGDGTTTVVILAGELLKECKAFIEEGVHPQAIIKAFRKAVALAVQLVKDASVSIEGKDPEDKKALLRKCASTTLNSKLVSGEKEFSPEIAIEAVSRVSGEKEFFAKMVVEAVSRLDPATLAMNMLGTKKVSGEKEFFAEMVVEAVSRLDPTTLDMNMLGTKKVQGGGLRDSFLVDGVAFKKTFSYAGFEMQPKSYTDPCVLLLNIELELKSEKENAEIRLSDPAQYQSIVDAEWNIIYDKLQKCADSGAKIILSRLAIGDLGTQFFADRDIFCAGRVAEEDLKRVAAATGGVVQSTVNNLDPKVLGTCARFEEVQVGAERFNLFKGCPKAKTATMVLRGGSEQFIDEAERSLHDAIMIVRRAIKNASVVAGGGAIDMEISRHLRDHARTIPGKAQQFMIAFAKALEVIPRQLCDNAGFDATDVLNKLRQKHALKDGSGKSFGVDVNTGGVVDTYGSFVWEPSLVKTNAITAATEAACLILSVDETVRNPRSQPPEGAGAGGPMPGRGGPMGMRGRGRGRGRGMRR